MLTGLYSAWLTEVVLLTYRATRKGANAGTVSVPLPLPAQYAATFIVFGALGLIPGEGQKVAGVVGWGLVVATLLNFWDPSGKVRLTPGSTVPTSETSAASPPGVTTRNLSASTGTGVVVNPSTGTARVPGRPVAAQ